MSERLFRNFPKYLTMPISRCTPETSVGVSISKMALIFAGSALTPSRVRRCPIKETSSHLNLNSSASNLMLLS